MGKVRKRERDRARVAIPTTALKAIRQMQRKSDVPVPLMLQRKRVPRDYYIPMGTLQPKDGMTPEERLIAKAPAEATRPEAMVYGWLVVNNIDFAFQVNMEGGRIPGGQVADFEVYFGPVPIVIRIQSYWHQDAQQEMEDEALAAVLWQNGYQVEDIWEDEIRTYATLDKTMRETLMSGSKAQGGAYSEYAQMSEYIGSVDIVHDRAVCPHCGQPECFECGGM